MKTKKYEVGEWIEIKPNDPHYDEVARRYNRHVDRMNRKMRRYHAWRDFFHKLFPFWK